MIMINAWLDIAFEMNLLMLRLKVFLFNNLGFQEMSYKMYKNAPVLPGHVSVVYANT